MSELFTGSERCLFQSSREFHTAPGNVVMTAEIMPHPVMLLCGRLPQERVCAEYLIDKSGGRKGFITVH